MPTIVDTLRSRGIGTGVGLSVKDKQALIDAVNAADLDNDLTKIDVITKLQALVPTLGLTNASTWGQIRTAIASIPKRDGDTVALSSQISGTTLRLLATAGYRDGIDDFVTLTDADFLSANILTGRVVHGLAGTATSDASAVAADLAPGKTAYVNGVKITGNSTSKRLATGNLNVSNNQGTGSANLTVTGTVSGLSFTPSQIFVLISAGTTYSLEGNGVCASGNLLNVNLVYKDNDSSHGGGTQSVSISRIFRPGGFDVTATCTYGNKISMTNYIAIE